MPIEFTSHQFMRAARSEGVTETVMRNGGTAGFLGLYCDHPSKFTWKRRFDKNSAEENKEVSIQNNQDEFESECVEYLKGLGYKIFKMKEV